MDRRGWQAIFRQMAARDLVRPDPERHGALRMTEAARPVLRGEERLELRRDALTRSDRPQPKAMVAEEDAPLLSALKARRRELAQAQGVPAYVVFPDRTLIEMAERRPQTLDEMARIGGVGAVKLERYGSVFLKVVTGETPDPSHPQRRRLAGDDAGALFDRLHAAQRDLLRGEDGTGKPLSLTNRTLRSIAEDRPGSLDDLARVSGVGPQKAERFGPAFLAILAGD
jgi:ATP-dependent DNA helicase RecQ